MRCSESRTETYFLEDDMNKDLKQPFCTGQRASTIALVRREASLADVSLSAIVEAAIVAYCEAIEQVRQEERNVRK